MNTPHILACGLFLTLLSVRMEAKPLNQSQEKSLRNLLGEELSEYLTSTEQEGNSKLENIRTKGRLLRDLRIDTRSKAAWARILHDFPNPSKKYKGINKKGMSKGCFGLKLDRIGSMSGLGC
ncbi:C-type natriuretic peptide [Protopterus annectens]|uniref:C-type natriuretic peptide n=1 Tax=Protopterus annectens TaxID=7888 RepID=UPI001CFB0B60|nr:C-type natriuretic peptide [Protopterus annectens]